MRYLSLASNLAVAALALSGCTFMAVATAPAKPVSLQTPETAAIAGKFWDALHGGRYQDIDNLLELHMRTLVKDSGEPSTVAHVGFLHAWKLSERRREPAPGAARVVEHATLARRYFDEAVALDPKEARFKGFAASFTMAEGQILKRDADVRRGYYMMQDAVGMWPEFNLFTSGYVMSMNPVDNWQFKQALAQQWQTLDLCFGAPVSRSNPSFTGVMAMQTTTGPKRACWNSWIAAHNWEGFFLNFGDMLIRAGDKSNARTMYEAARMSETYAAWPYRGVLERRLQSLDTLQQRFANAAPDEKEMVPMFNSAFACSGCHQKTGAPAVVAQR